MHLKPLAVYSPWHLESSEPPDLSSPAYRFLAEGDSWFSIGTLNPAKNSNLLFEMAFEQSACAVSCASPGDTLRRMSQINADAHFEAQLVGRAARVWDGILLSCGGNDLIDALGVRGAGIARDKRLLLAADEWGASALGPARYLSDDGWQTFSTYLQANLAHMVERRDAGPSRGCPIFLHGYAVPTPRPAGAGLGIGPWLLPAVAAYAIPEADRTGVAGELILRLAQLLGTCAQRLPAVHFFDGTGLPVVPARPGTGGQDGDWINEIHLTWQGYEKIALPWSAAIEAVLRGR